nr:MAG TPA: hypothetical protein [Bacteriophage sp.]
MARVSTRFWICYSILSMLQILQMQLSASTLLLNPLLRLVRLALHSPQLLLLLVALQRL